MKRKFEKLKFNELTEDQLNQLTEKEVIDKDLEEYVEEINLHVKEIDNCKKNIIGSLVLMVLIGFTLGLSYSTIPLAVAIFYTIGLYKMKKSIVWHVRTLKCTASIYIDIGYEIYVRPHLNRVNEKVYIGELYK